MNSTPVIRATAVMVVLLLTACASVQRQPVPIEAMDRAVIPGLPGVRDWGDQPSGHFQEDLIRSERELLESDERAPVVLPMSALVLSGGGSNGAFGAGFLNGWTEAGTRPTFKLVTGISTGALIAPFAFLGPDYDALLEEVFTTVSRKDVYRIRSPFNIFKKDSLTRTDPLALNIQEMIDSEILEAIANEHRRGRRLYVGTTNLDAQRFVVWNMGAIAASNKPGSLELFHRVLLASASIPVAFPPVYIEVEVDGERFDEMHVDGGVISQLFLWGAMIDVAVARTEMRPGRDVPTPASIYIIRNGQIDAAAEQVDPELIGIASRSMITLLKAVAMSDLARIWEKAERAGVDFNYVGIPPEQSETPTATFNPREMRRLFDLGRAIALEPDPWRKEPPSWVQ